MRGVSAAAQSEVLGRVDAAVDSGADAAALGSDLFAVAALLDAQPGLRRAVTDPSMPGAARSGLLAGILAEKVTQAAGEVASAAAGERWSATRDLGDALEHAGVVAQVVAAEQAGEADELEDELFRFDRIVAGDSRLREVLTDRTIPTFAKQQLVRNLLEDQASAPSVRLAEQAVAGRHRSFEAAVHFFTRIAADRRQSFIATVRSAAPLSDADQSRLAAALQRQYGRQVHLNLVVDRDVVGGLRVEIGDEVIDGTVASKIDDARRRLAG